MGVTIRGLRSDTAIVHARSLLTVAPVQEPLTLDEAKLYAGLDWAPGDPRDAWMTRLLKAAREMVERDTGLALFTQTREVYFDNLPPDPILLPAHSSPLQAVVALKYIDTAGLEQTIDPVNYIADATLPARLALADLGVWPSDTRRFQPWVFEILAGWDDVNLIPAALTHAVGLLVAHYATLGRDIVTTPGAGGIDEIPHGYADIIAPHALIYL